MKKYIVKPTIRSRIILLFVMQIIIVLGITGFYLSWYLRDALENELGEKLELAAASIAAQLDAELLLSLNPGDEETRTYHSFQDRLRENRDATGIRRVSIVNRQFQIIVDTEPNISIGKTHIALEMDQKELALVWKGNSQSSVLFKGLDDKLYKSGYAPLYLENSVVAVVVVEGSAHTLDAVSKLTGHMLRLGVFAILFAILLALLFSSRLIRPINKLTKSAEIIGKGDYTKPIHGEGNDELAFLARTMEEMRLGVVKRDSQLKAMLAGVAHEIRNPLGGIELFAGLLLDELQNPDQKERANKILCEVQNLKAIVTEFLNYARPAEPKREPCRLDSLLAEIKSLMVKEFEQHNTLFLWSFKKMDILIDPKHAKQIFINLTKNSLQAIKEKGEISVEAIPNNKHIAVIFRDTGSGIPQHAQKQLFEPFFTTNRTGTGLGLAIVKTLCEANHGSIELFETDSHGTAFKLVFEKVLEE